MSAPILQAPTLNLPALDTLVSGRLPFIYDLSLSESTIGGLQTLFANITRKSVAELGLPANWTPAINPVLDALAHDDTLSSAVLAQTTQSEFQNAFTNSCPSTPTATWR